MRIRDRRPADAAALLELAGAVRAVDGYPPVVDGLFDDASTLGAWVAVDENANENKDDDAGGRMVGHVALHADGAVETLELAAGVTGLAADRLGVVSRLLVAPDARRRGIGRALLGVAVDASHALGRRPVLDVSVTFAAAIALYDAVGWSPAGPVDFTFHDAGTRRRASSIVYIGPAPSL